MRGVLRYKLEVYRQHFSDKSYGLGVPKQSPCPSFCCCCCRFPFLSPARISFFCGVFLRTCSTTTKDTNLEFRGISPVDFLSFLQCFFSPGALCNLVRKSGRRKQHRILSRLWLSFFWVPILFPSFSNNFKGSVGMRNPSFEGNKTPKDPFVLKMLSRWKSKCSLPP